MIFGFRKRQWADEVLEELNGKYGAISIVLKNFPCRVDQSSNERRFSYPEFGQELISTLMNRELQNLDQLRQTIAFGSSKSVSVKLRDLPTIGITVSGTPSSSDRQFQSDIADALIAAFESKNIRS